MCHRFGQDTIKKDLVRLTMLHWRKHLNEQNMKRTTLCLLIIMMAFAQPGYSKKTVVPYPYDKLMDYEDDGDGPPVVDPPPPAPINGWIPVLFVAGTALIGYKTRKH